MDESNKLSLKRVELSLSKFNEVAIPHHLDLLRQHRANIVKYEQAGDYGRVRAEQTRAQRVAAQLRALLAELEALRGTLRAADLPRFDALTQSARDRTLRAIMDYLESSPMSISRPAEEPPAAASSAVSTDSVGVVAHAHPDAELIQLQVDDAEVSLRDREAALRGWVELQRELRALHHVWQHVHDAATAQRDQVEAVTSSAEVAAENVEAARTHLASAHRLRAGALTAGGAALGALLGGPVGLAVGAKAGAAAALAGSLLGFMGVRFLERRTQPASAPPTPPQHGAHLTPEPRRKLD